MTEPTKLPDETREAIESFEGSAKRLVELMALDSPICFTMDEVAIVCERAMVLAKVVVSRDAREAVAKWRDGR